MRSCSAASTEARKRKDQLWEDLFCNPWNWWDNRLDKKGPARPDFRHRLSGEVLWVNDWHKPSWVDSRLCNLHHDHTKSQAFYREIQILCDQGHTWQALDLLLSPGFSPYAHNEFMYLPLLKACAKAKALAPVRHVQCLIHQSNLQVSGWLADHVILALSSCGATEDAYCILLSLPSRSVYSWTAIISGYAALGRGRDAFDVYIHMQEDGVKPDPYTFVSLLKACTLTCNLDEAEKLHADAAARGFTTNVFVGNMLVSMYSKCGKLSNAVDVFEGLLERNPVSWSGMLSAYVECGQEKKGLQLYRQMKDENVGISPQALALTLQACCNLVTKAESFGKDRHKKTQLMCLELGHALHAEARNCSTQDKFVFNMLLALYGNCGKHAETQAVLCALFECDVVSWNTMLSTYVDSGQGKSALQLFEQMLAEGTCPDRQTSMISLQACMILGEAAHTIGEVNQITSLEIGRALHIDALNKGFLSDIFVGNTIVSMYGKCGSTVEAMNVFEELPERDIVSWNAMHSAYVKQGQAEKALRVYWQMVASGVDINQVTFLISFQACGILADKVTGLVESELSSQILSLEIGRALHVDAQRKGFTLDISVGNSLVHMYGKCGSVLEAETAFNGLHESDIVSWGTMLLVYVEQGTGERALQLYRQMQVEGTNPDQHAFVIALQACGTMLMEDEVMNEPNLPRVMCLEIVRSLHTDAERVNFFLDSFVGNTLLSIYGKCGSILEAETVFVGLPKFDIVSWTALLSVYVEQGQGENALGLYRQMNEEGFSPNSHTLVISLQACIVRLGEDEAMVEEMQSINSVSLHIGRGLHADARKGGFTADVFLLTALLMMYSKCGSVLEALNIYDVLYKDDIALWNAMLSVFVEQGQGEKALQLYLQCLKEGVKPDQETFAIAFQACSLVVVTGKEYEAKVVPLDIGRALHTDVQKKGLLSDVFLCNAIIRMYGKCGCIVEALNLFGGLSNRNHVTWSVMLSTYVEHGQGENALQLYKQMKEQGVPLDESSLLYSLECSKTTGNLELCRQLHFSISHSGYEQLPLWGRALMRAYGGCACLVDAQAVFDRMLQHDVVSWSAFIALYAQEGKCEASLAIFQQMQQAGVAPNGVTFLSLLSVCTHAGVSTKGVQFFEVMTKDYGIVPSLKHYVAMVDLLACAGEFKRMEDVLLQMPMQATWSIWMCVLGACHKYGNVEVAKWAFDHAVVLKPEEAGPYILMSNIYAEAGLCKYINEGELRLKAKKR